MKNQVFLSYVSKDREWAREFADALRSHDVSVWFDSDELAIGDVIATQIQNAIRESDTLVVLLSQHSASSRWMFAEIGAAIATGKRIVPVLIDDSDALSSSGIVARYQALRESSATEAGARIAAVITEHTKTPNKAVNPSGGSGEN